MFKVTTEIYNALSQVDGLKVFTEDYTNKSEVWLQFGHKTGGGSYRIHFISTKEKNDVAVRVFGLVKASADNRAAVIETINELNSKYRYAKFCLKEDGDVNLEYDFLASCSNPAESARDLVILILQIVEEAYPTLMRTLWA